MLPYLHAALLAVFWYPQLRSDLFSHSVTIFPGWRVFEAVSNASSGSFKSYGQCYIPSITLVPFPLERCKATRMTFSHRDGKSFSNVCL